MRAWEAWVVCRTCQAGFPCLEPGAVEFMMKHVAIEEQHEMDWLPRREALLVVSKQHRLRGAA